TGKSSAFTGEPGVAIWPILAAEWRPWDRFRLGANAGYRLHTGTDGKFPVNGRTDPMGLGMGGNATNAVLTSPGHVLTYNDLLTFGVGASFRAIPVLDVVGEIYGSQVVTDFGSSAALSLEALGGIKLFVQRNSYLALAGGGGILRNGFQTADWRGV